MSGISCLRAEAQTGDIQDESGPRGCFWFFEAARAGMLIQAGERAADDFLGSGDNCLSSAVQLAYHTHVVGHLPIGPRSPSAPVREPHQSLPLSSDLLLWLCLTSCLSTVRVTLLCASVCNTAVSGDSTSKQAKKLVYSSSNVFALPSSVLHVLVEFKECCF